MLGDLGGRFGSCESRAGQRTQASMRCCQSRWPDRASGVQVKKGPFAEVSPMLNDISGLESWRKVCHIAGLAQLQV